MFERDGTRYVPTQLARGPWSPKALHGGAPSALFATVCEMHDPGPAAFVARLTVELMRPVPLAPLELRVRTIRPGQEGAVDRGDAARRGRARGRARDRAAHPLRRRRHERVGASGGRRAAAARLRSTRRTFPFGEGAVGFWNVHDVRLVRGSGWSPGPGIAWFRLHCPVIAGEPISPIARVAAAADFGSGRREPRAHDQRGRDQPGADRARPPAPGRRVGVPRVGGVGAAARSRHGRDAPARRARRHRARRAVAAGRAGGGLPIRDSDRVADPGQSSSDLRSTSVAQSSNSPLR